MDENNINITPEVKEKTTLVDKIRKLLHITNDTKLGGETGMLILLLIGIAGHTYSLISYIVTIVDYISSILYLDAKIAFLASEIFILVFSYGIYFASYICFIVYVLKPNSKVSLKVTLGVYTGCQALTFLFNFIIHIKDEDTTAMLTWSKVVFATVGILLLVVLIEIIKKCKKKKLFTRILTLAVIICAIAYAMQTAGNIIFAFTQYTVTTKAIISSIFAQIRYFVKENLFFIAVLILAKKNDLSQLFAQKEGVIGVDLKFGKGDTSNIEKELSDLRDLLDNGIITESEYNDKRAEILTRL